MNSTFSVSTNAFEYLVRHLVDVEEQKDRFLNEYFPDLTRERADTEELINSYIIDLEGLVKRTKAHHAQDCNLPFVVIGSQVEVINMSTGRSQQFRILKPFEPGVRARGTFNVSCFSPVGKALLLQQPGNTVLVNAPAGTFEYQIRSISVSGPEICEPVK